MWQVYNDGGVIAGTSAGAAVLSRVMFADPDTVLATLKKGVKFGKEIDEGLGFLDHGWFVEQHCMTRGRFARALVAMHSQGLKFGIGVDENTACVVRNGTEVEVVGFKGAVVLDLSNASHDPDVPGFNLKNVRMTYLDHGDTFDLDTLTVTPAKQKVAGSMPHGEELESEAEPFMFPDILANTTVVEVLGRLMQRRKVEAIGLAFDGLAARRNRRRASSSASIPARIARAGTATFRSAPDSRSATSTWMCARSRYPARFTNSWHRALCACGARTSALSVPPISILPRCHAFCRRQ